MSWIWQKKQMEVSINGGTPQSSIYKWIFPYKPSSYWGYPHLRKSPDCYPRIDVHLIYKYYTWIIQYLIQYLIHNFFIMCIISSSIIHEISINSNLFRLVHLINSSWHFGLEVACRKLSTKTGPGRSGWGCSTRNKNLFGTFTKPDVMSLLVEPPMLKNVILSVGIIPKWMRK